jgi:rhamnosyltransferase
MSPALAMPQSAPDNVPQSELWGVVVTYNPAPDFENNVRALVQQVKELIIVDNQSSPAIQQFIARVASTYGARIIWGQENRGIAPALNAGMNLALASVECRWILMLDQDSHVPPDFVATMFDAYEACPFKDRVGLIAANYHLALRNLPKASAGDKAQMFREVGTLMTSGTLVKRSVFADCGSFDESFFMDYVDHDFCLRVRRRGFRIIQANHAVLQHRLGSPTSHRLFGKYLTASNYSPNRRYHNTRNRIIVYRRYFRAETPWIIGDCLKWCRETLKMILVERDRKQKLASIARGLWDGFRAPK